MTPFLRQPNTESQTAFTLNTAFYTLVVMVSLLALQLINSFCENLFTGGMCSLSVVRKSRSMYHWDEWSAAVKLIQPLGC